MRFMCGRMALRGFDNSVGLKGRHSLDDLHGFEADGDDLPNQADDVLGVVGVVGVVVDVAAFVGADLVLVNDVINRPRIHHSQRARHGPKVPNCPATSSTPNGWPRRPATGLTHAWPVTTMTPPRGLLLLWHSNYDGQRPAGA